MSLLSWLPAIILGAVLLVSASRLFIWLWMLADAWRHPSEWID